MLPVRRIRCLPLVQLVLASVLGACLLAPPMARAASGVISDVQVLQLGPTHYRLVLRSTAPLAFDRIPQTTGFALRLYGSRLGTLTLPNTSGFGGTLALQQESTGSVLLTLVNTGMFAVTARAGHSPGTVEIHIDR